jgi:hypothetical protein
LLLKNPDEKIEDKDKFDFGFDSSIAPPSLDEIKKFTSKLSF